MVDDIPASVSPEDAWEFSLALRKGRMNDAVKERLVQERIEREAAQVVMVTGLSGTDFLADDLKAPEWVIEGLLHHQGKAILAAQYETGKSTFMLNVISALTSGKPFLDEYAVPRPMRVAYMDLELGKSMAQRWLRDVPGLVDQNLLYFPLLGHGPMALRLP